MGYRSEKDRRTENLTMRTNLDLSSIGIHIIAGLPVGRVYAVSDSLWRELTEMSEGQIESEIWSGRLAGRIKGRAAVMDIGREHQGSEE
jgi:hypothetical protein